MKMKHAERPEDRLRDIRSRIAAVLGIEYAETRSFELSEAASQIAIALENEKDNAQYYDSDEREMELFEDFRYCEERQGLVARFVPTDPERTVLTHSEASYIEVLEFARFLHESRIRPTESFKALRAMDAHIDREAAKITSSGQSSAPRPPAP